MLLSGYDHDETFCLMIGAVFYWRDPCTLETNGNYII